MSVWVILAKLFMLDSSRNVFQPGNLSLTPRRHLSLIWIGCGVLFQSTFQRRPLLPPYWPSASIKSPYIAWRKTFKSILDWSMPEKVEKQLILFLQLGPPSKLNHHKNKAFANTRGIWKCWPFIFEWMENKNGAFRELKWSVGAVWLIAAGAYPGFYSMKWLGIFLLPLDEMLIHHRSLRRNLLGFSSNLPVPIYTPRWREALWELSVLPKNTTQCPGQTQTACSRNERTDHEATAPLENQGFTRIRWFLRLSFPQTQTQNDCCLLYF